MSTIGPRDLVLLALDRLHQSSGSDIAAHLSKLDFGNWEVLNGNIYRAMKLLVRAGLIRYQGQVPALGRNGEGRPANLYVLTEKGAAQVVVLRRKLLRLLGLEGEDGGEERAD